MSNSTMLSKTNITSKEENIKILEEVQEALDNVICESDPANTDGESVEEFLKRTEREYRIPGVREAMLASDYDKMWKIVKANSEY